MALPPFGFYRYEKVIADLLVGLGLFGVLCLVPGVSNALVSLLPGFDWWDFFVDWPGRAILAIQGAFVAMGAFTRRRFLGVPPLLGAVFALAAMTPLGVLTLVPGIVMFLGAVRESRPDRSLPPLE